MRHLNPLWLVPLLIGWLTGCASPNTRFGFDPLSRTFEFSDSKDNSLAVKNLEVVWKDGSIKCDEMVISNNASDVRRANVEQIRAGYEGAAVLFPALTDSLVRGAIGVAPYLRPVRQQGMRVNPTTGEVEVTGSVAPVFAPAPPPPPATQPVVPVLVPVEPR